MDLHLRLYELGFPPHLIDFAEREGHDSFDQIIQFLCGRPRHRLKRLLCSNWRHLRTPEIPRIHSPDIDHPTYRRKNNSSIRYEPLRCHPRTLLDSLRFGGSGRTQCEHISSRPFVNTVGRRSLMDVDNSAIFIKFHLDPYFPPISPPNIGQFNPTTSTQQDLVNFAQFLISDIGCQHHSSVSMDLPCIRLTTTTNGGSSSRRQLNNPVTRACLLADLGITRSTTVLLEHDFENCLSNKQSGDVFFSHRLRAGDSRSHNFIVPRRPWVERYSETLPRLLGIEMSEWMSEEFSFTAPLSSLREMCVNLLVRYIEVIGRLCLGLYSVHDFSTVSINSLRILSEQLSWASVPMQLSAEIVDKLRRDYQLNASTLGLLKNFVYYLDLNHYQINREMINELVAHWSGLAGLNLAYIPCTLTAMELKALSKLENLRYLNITGQEFVDSTVLRSIAALPKLESLAITNSRYSECCWEELRQFHRFDDIALPPLQVLAVNGIAFNDASLLAVVQLFPRLRVLNFKDTEVTGLYHSVDGVESLQELRFIMCSRRLAVLPQFLVPKIISSETGRGLIQVDVQGCNKLNIGDFLNQIKGQPTQLISGLTALPSVEWEDIERLSEIGIPLKELDLSFLTPAFSASTLAKIVRNLSRSLCKLCLPISGCLEAVDNKSVDELVSSFLMARYLQEIDFGELLKILSTRQLIDIVRGLSNVKRVSVRNITKERQTELIKALPPKCSLKIVETPNDS